ncbi:MAG: hypothetical protein PHO41_00580, partial [Eubacteriales bacterium]|nr:hypothetical protein [Eubacteriales bacterium]
MKRMLAILLTALLLTALLPATAFAETTNYVDSGRVTLPNPGGLLMELGQNTQAAPLHKVSVYDIGSIFMDTGTSKRVVELCVSLPSIANADSITGFNTENIYTNTNTGNKFASFEFAFTDAELEAEAITGSRKIDWKDASGAVLYTEYLNYEIWLDTSGGFSGVSRVPKSRVTVSVNDALTSNADGKNVTWACKDDKLVFTMGDIPAERWQRAYAELGSGATVILADIRIAAPSADCKYVKDIQ